MDEEAGRRKAVSHRRLCAAPPDKTELALHSNERRQFEFGNTKRRKQRPSNDGRTTQNSIDTRAELRMEVRQTLTASPPPSSLLPLPLFSSCAHREFKSPPILEGKEEEEEEEIVSTVTAATSERAAARACPPASLHSCCSRRKKKGIMQSNFLLRV